MKLSRMSLVSGMVSSMERIDEFEYTLSLNSDRERVARVLSTT